MRQNRLRAVIVALVAGLLFASGWADVSGAATQGEASTRSSAAAEFSGHLQKAREDFLAHELSKAGDEIKAAALLMRQESKIAADEADSRAAAAAAAALEKMAAQTVGGQTASVQALDHAFVQAHQAMAEYHRQEAVKSWREKVYPSVAEHLTAVLSHLQYAWTWTGQKLQPAAADLAAFGQYVVQKLTAGGNWAEAEVAVLLEDVKREIDNLGDRKAEVHMAGKGSAADLNLATALVAVAKEGLPAVVQINVTKRQEVTNPFAPFEEDPFFQHFFGLPREPKKFEREEHGLGSGMIIDGQGHILTNDHVVGGATELQVLLADGRLFKARVVGTDPKTDLGVIKIDAGTPLPYVTFGNSDAIQVGDWVVAIGHPQGLGQTVTQGIISAMHRTGITNPSDYQDFLQTDAAINPGNSGGPLLNLSGEVIGINSSILSQSGGFEGIGFAIPSNMATRVVRALIEHGRVERGWLGASLQDLTPELAEKFGLKVPQGALIAEAMKGGPAAQAGLQPGDVILAFAGEAVRDASSLRNMVANTSIGQEVTITIWRNEKKMDLQVKIGNLKEQAQKLADTLKERLGVVLAPISAKEAKKYNLGKQGMRIIWIDSNGPLGRAGLEKDDIILQIDNHPVTSVSELMTILETVGKDREAILLIMDHRTGQIGYLKVQL